MSLQSGIIVCNGPYLLTEEGMVKVLQGYSRLVYGTKLEPSGSTSLEYLRKKPFILNARETK